MVVYLHQFTNAVRARMEGGDEGNVEEVTMATLTAYPYSEHLAINTPGPGDAVADRIFNTLIASPQFSFLVIQTVPRAGFMLEMFCQAVTHMQNLVELDISVEMSYRQADAMLSVLQTSRPTLERLCIHLGAGANGIAGPLSRFLQGPQSVETLGLSWGSVPPQDGDGNEVPRAVVTTICEGIAASTSLHNITVLELPPDRDVKFAAESIARASMASTSLLAITVEFDLPLQSMHQQIRSTLVQSEAARNFNLFFREFGQGPPPLMHFLIRRDARWRQFLGEDVPLNFWPIILAETNAWTRQDSHRPLDLLFFLLKEKHDVLFQNVRRR